MEHAPTTWRLAGAQRLKQTGDKRSASVSRMSEALLPKVRDMAARGSTQKVIADSLGIAQKTVSNWLKG